MTKQPQPHLLLVDDNRNLLVTLSDFLSYEGFRVTLALSGEEALQKLESLAPDLIVLDISMPGMGGLGFLKRIGDGNGYRYPVLILTARGHLDPLLSSLNVDGFLSKPCSEETLLRRVRELLAHQAARRRTAARGRPMVLLAEDDSTVEQALRAHLESAGFETEVVCNGPGVLERAAIEHPDVIVMKEVLPKMNGTAVATLVETMPTMRGVPIVLYDATPSGATARESSMMPNCVRRRLTTVDTAEVLQAVREVLNHGNRNAAAGAP